MVGNICSETSDLSLVNDEIYKKLDTLAKELEEREAEIINKIEEANRCYAIEAVASDISENAAYDKAIEDIGKFNSELTNIKSQIVQLEEIKLDYHDYEHAPYISESSIVRIALVGVQGIPGLKDEYVIKLTANGFNAREYGMISSENTIGSQLLSKTVGSVIAIRNKAFPNLKSNYKVIDFY